MIKNILNNIVRILKNNLFIIISFFVTFFILTFPLPYYIETPGGIINVNERIKINNKKELSGSFNMVYVGELRATIPTLIIAKFNKNWDIIKNEEVVANNENEKDMYLRDRLYLKESNKNAIILAYKKANKEVSITDEQVIVTYIDEISETDLKIGDQIISIDNEIINSKEQLKNILTKKEVGEIVNFHILRDNKEMVSTAKIIEYDNNKIIGILVTENKDIKTNPNIEINFKSSESGSSGGLMMALTIYNLLVDDDITKGYKIIGTGTIDENGNVGSIDGIKYKLKVAVDEKADIFFVPSEKNYEEAIKLSKENNYDINIVSIETFDDALNYLQNKKHK